MKSIRLLLFVTLFGVFAFCLALALDATAPNAKAAKRSDNFFALMFGDGRKLLANQFFTMADVYYHSGYYPSVFDRKSEDHQELLAGEQNCPHGCKDHKEHAAHEQEEDFLGEPQDWIEAFGRNFKITEHTHLEQGREREILPWLRLAASLDPHKIETYTVGAFFLREHLNRADQAELFLREGLRENPESAELYYELGRLYRESLHDLDRARNVWELGAKKFTLRTSEEQQETKLVFQGTVVNLANLEREAGNYRAAIGWFRLAQRVSLTPDALQVQIDELLKKLPATP